MTCTEQFPINFLWDRKPSITVEIECEASAPHGVKLGLAVKAALKGGAKLSGADLSGAKLSGADLYEAKLHRADLCGADLSGAKLSWVKLSGAILADCITAKRLLARATRLHDGYEGLLFETETGDLFGRFGCRAMSLDDFEKHVSAYADDDPRKGQSEDIIAYFRAAAARTHTEEAA